jgi:endonuclease-3 related protein
MPSLDESYPSMVLALAACYGQPQSIPQARSTFEASLAVTLSRASESPRVERVIEALGRAGLLEPEALAAADRHEVLDVLGEASVRLPAKSIPVLQRLARLFASRYSSEVDTRDEPAWPTSKLRQELASISGIGQATADAILLFAFGRAAYPVDRATYRILIRHGWIDTTAEYEDVADLLVRHASSRPDELANLSRWLVQVGHQFCRVRSPECSRCPLQSLLPEGGPLEPYG